MYNSLYENYLADLLSIVHTPPLFLTPSWWVGKSGICRTSGICRNALKTLKWPKPNPNPEPDPNLLIPNPGMDPEPNPNTKPDPNRFKPYP